MNQCRILLLVLAALYSINLYAAGDTEFKQGMAAFRKGNYSSALKAFKKAEQAGLQSGRGALQTRQPHTVQTLLQPFAT